MVPQLQRNHGAFLKVQLRAGPTRDGASDAAAILRRAVLTRGIYQPWGEGRTYEECFASIRAFPSSLKAPCMGPDTTFRCRVRSPGRTIP